MNKFESPSGFYKFIATKITNAANSITTHVKVASSASYLVTNSKVYNMYVESLIRDSMQQKVISPLFDERLLYSDENWRTELSKADLKYIKTVLFKVLFNTSFDDYAKGIQSTEEKLNLVHSKLKSIYREELNFLKDREHENI